MTLLIKNCLFSNGKSNVGHGGLLFVFAPNTRILIKDSILTNLTTIGDGGVIYATARQIVKASIKLDIKNSSFIRNLATLGGVIYVPSHAKATVTIHNCKFIMNEARSACGFMRSLSVHVVKVFIENSLFEKNTASTGGCLSVEGVSEHHVEFVLIGSNVTFRRNIAWGPGVMTFVAGVIRVSFSRVIFEENQSLGEPGGVIHVSRNQSNKQPNSLFSLTASHTRFVGNYANGPGGVIYVELGFRSVFVFQNSTFLDNSASAPGGAFYMELFDDDIYYNTSYFEITIKRCLFEGNFGSSMGGTIYFEGNNGVFTCEDSVFRSSFANYPGGAVYLQMLNSTINVVNTTFFNNTSFVEGGAVYMGIGKQSNVYLDHTKFEQNHAIHSGGGLAILASHDTLRESGCDGMTLRTWNYCNSVEIKNTQFTNNIGGTGGAVSMTNGRVDFTNCTFIDNFASVGGGQVINYGTNSLKLIDCTFRQTISNMSLVKHPIYLTSFIHTYSTGPFQATNTTIDEQALWGSNPLIIVSNGGLVEFDNFSSIICPLGTFVSWLNLSYNDWINKSCSLEVTVLRLQCEECERGFYSLQRGHTRGSRVVNDFACLSCPNGAQCFPAIKSKANFWGYLVNNNPPALNFTLCPEGYCRSANKSSDGYNSCYGHREDWMCGRCASGYSETLFSTSCRVSKDCKDTWFWAVFLAYVFIMALFLIFKPPIVTFAAKQALWFKHCGVKNQASVRNETESLAPLQVDTSVSTLLLSTEESENEKLQAVGFLEIIFYFYQISNLLLTSTLLEQLLKTKVIIPVQGIFNFQTRLLGHEGLVCPLPGLTAETKQLFEVLPIFGTLAAIYLIYAFQCIVCKLRRTTTPSLAHYLGATMETLLLGYAQIANVSLSLVRCVPVGSKSRWFYNGTIVCYQWWQIVLIAFDVIVVVPFIFVLAWGAMKLHSGTLSAKKFLLACVFPLPFLILWLLQSLGCYSNQHNHVESNQYTEALKVVLLTPFREPRGGERMGALYWESIFIARRFILVFLYCFITDSTLRLLCMTVVCVLALLHHTKMEPFRNNPANIAETTSLLGLVILANINMYKSFYAISKQEVSSDWMAIFEVLDWIEIVLLGFIPAMVALVVLFGLISLIARLIFVVCTNMYTRINGALTRSNGRAPLDDMTNNDDDER